MAQADFSPENAAWNSMDLRLQESGLLTDGRLDLPDAPVRMEFRFGLIPEGVGPVARPWLKQARLLDE